MQVVTLLDEAVTFGDLNGDGSEDAVAVLAIDRGGSGTFYYLTPIFNVGGQPQPMPATLLGDRVQVKTVTIAAWEVVVDMVEAGPDDPMCCPMQETTTHYTFQDDGALVEVAGTSPTIVGPVWGWEQTMDTSTGETLLVSNGPERYTIQFNKDGSYTAQRELCRNRDRVGV